MEAAEFEHLFKEHRSYSNVAVSDGEMSPLERFNAIYEFNSFDRIIDTEFGYWNNTLRRWHSEGLPEYVDNNQKADVYFGFDNWSNWLGAKVDLFPAFEPKVISDDGEHRIVYNSEHVKCEVFSDGTDTIPHYLDFPVKDKKSYRELFKQRLQPSIDRLPKDIENIAQQVKDRNYVLMGNGGSTAGKIRDWMGFENICLAIYDQPELLEEILRDRAEVSKFAAEEFTKHMSFDCVFWWEDIAFKTGPIVTPDFFINSCGKVIKEVMDIYKSTGTKYGMVDCDGDFRRIIPGWTDNGVNIMFPLEVKSGLHPVNLRKEFPGIRMKGGFDKTILSGHKDDIRKELLVLKKLSEEGGYIPHVDHRVQSDISYENYLYYLEVKRDIFEIPNKIVS
jgi:uroporphyrinogen decarboxylase